MPHLLSRLVVAVLCLFDMGFMCIGFGGVVSSKLETNSMREPSGSVLTPWTMLNVDRCFVNLMLRGCCELNVRFKVYYA